MYLNCGDPYESNFFRYFALNFNHLGLKRLIATSYTGSPIAGEVIQIDLADKGLSESDTAQANVIDISEVADYNNDGRVDLSDVEWLLNNDHDSWQPLTGNGDFRSAECVELLEQADIVVTNPPFSLFREYIAQLVEHDKKFLIIGPQGAIIYKNVFPLIKDRQVWLGIHNGPKTYIRPGGEQQTLGNTGWFTNLDHGKRHEELILVERYSREFYPKYDNYDAVNVDKVADIPKDYDGPMGVPITYLGKHCPEQFEILDANDLRTGDSVRTKPHGLIQDGSDGAVNGKSKYARIVIRRRVSS